jgi:hypothetical protein
MDNLDTHEPESLYEAFPPDKAKALWDRFEFVYTPKHGSWLNMAEIELNVLTGQCLNRRIEDIAVVRNEVLAWQEFRNNKRAKVNLITIESQPFPKHARLTCRKYNEFLFSTKSFPRRREISVDFDP